MKHTVAVLGFLVAVALGGSSARGTDLVLTLSVKDGAASPVAVCPDSAIPFEVRGELVGSLDHRGLAGFAFDMAFDGGSLDPVSPGPQLANFIAPFGFTNAAGFGGMINVPGREGELVQIGGAQNTINNADDGQSPLYPRGVVTTGVSEAVLATGILTAPSSPGTYTLSIPSWSVRANVITLATTGNPFWETDAAGLGATSTLSVSIVVLDLSLYPLLTNDCNHDGVLDPCQDSTGPPSPLAELKDNAFGIAVPNLKNRMLSFSIGSTEQIAVRVTFGSLPPPYDVWSGAQMWVAQPDLGGMMVVRGPDALPEQADSGWRVDLSLPDPYYGTLSGAT